MADISVSGYSLVTTTITKTSGSMGGIAVYYRILT